MRLLRVFSLGTLLFSYGLMTCRLAHALDPKVSVAATAKAEETVAASKTVAAEATLDAFRSQVSKAYMNCLFEADYAAEGLSKNPQARDAEEKAHRTFCLTRKESCLRLGADADCKVFMEEFAE
jgi:hypothetical protein